MVSLKLTVASGLITAVLSAIAAGLTAFAANEPQYAGYVGLIVAVITAFISFESSTSTAP